MLRFVDNYSFFSNYASIITYEGYNHNLFLSKTFFMIKKFTNRLLGVIALIMMAMATSLSASAALRV